MEGGGSYDFGEAANVCLVSIVTISKKFKLSKFEKYRDHHLFREPFNHVV